MKCLDCGAEIENGIYLCGYCGKNFEEEEVEVMLRLEKKSRKKRARKNILITLFSVLVVAMAFAGWCYYFAKKAENRLIKSREAYYEAVKTYLDSMEDVYSYEYTDDSICLIIERGVWDDVSETEKHNFGDRVQREAYNMKYAAGFKQASIPTVQINSPEGEVMLTVDMSGKVQTY